MKSFVVARHGNYDVDLNLNMSGKEQMRQLAQALKQILGEGSILLLSSSAPRAIQSSQILSDELDVEFGTFNELWYCEDVDKAMKLILGKSDGYDHVIIMTHFEYSQSLPFVFAEKELSMPDLYHCSTLNGEAWIVNCFEKTCKCIP